MADVPGREMPDALQSLNAIPIDYADGTGIDFEPFSQFMTPEETTGWWRAWTGNEAVDGDDYLIFGQDGSGGYAALWRATDDLPMLEQPIVFFGSEGEIGVVASEFCDYLWLLAAGVGPFEAVADPYPDRPENAAFAAFAVERSVTPRRDPQQIVAAARAAFPLFEAQILALIR